VRKPSTPRLAIASYAKRPTLRPDDRLFAEAVAASGMEPVPVVWDDEGIEWDALDACVLRSVSDYYLKHDAFLEWTSRIGGSMPFWNLPALTVWNTDKTHLRSLAERGVPIIPTQWLERGEEVRLTALLDSHDWKDAVVKPTVGVGAKELFRVGGAPDADQRALDCLLERHGVMVQPFLPSVEKQGETSLVFIDSEFTHAVRKLPKVGDFRVQGNWGGTSVPCEASPEDLEMARLVLDCLDVEPLFARVDFVAGPLGNPCLIELELVEPILFFAENPPAAQRLAKAIWRRLRSS
jgi:glutathione synthase/RimK-type ligase-like ATP-grasp enzyme